MMQWAGDGAGDAFAAGLDVWRAREFGSRALLGIGACRCCLLAAQPCSDWVNRTVVGLPRSCKSMGPAQVSFA